MVDTASGDEHSVRSRYVVAADGSRSTVRGLAGISRSGDYATERFFRVVVRVKGDPDELKPYPSATNIIFNADYSGFLAAIDATDWRIHVGPFPLDHRPTDDEFLAAGRSAFGFEVDLEVVSATPFFKSTRLADQFVEGRIVLVGDAAHVRAPGGNLGQGFGDVFNLGWKLAAVLRGTGGETLLRSYDEERRPHNARVAAHALASSTRADENMARAREIGVPDDSDVSDEANRARAAIGAIIADHDGPAVGVDLDERYDASSVIWYEEARQPADPAWHPHRYLPVGRPGHRAPNGNVDPFGDTLYNRIGSETALLVLGPSTRHVAPFVEAAAERGIRLGVVYLDESDARTAYEAEFALVRPDHHVAWRGWSDVTVDAGAVLDRVYGRDARIGFEDDDEAREFIGVVV